MKKLLFIGVIIIISQSLFSQKIEIEGTITSESGEVVENATIQVKGTNKKTFSDENGNYKISTNQGATLVVTSIELTAEEVVVGKLSIKVVGSSNIIDFQLESLSAIFDLSLEELMNLEVRTASKVKQSIDESPASTYVVTEQMIKDRGYHHLEEILHDLPGFDFDKSFGVNYSTTFMRGYRSENSDRFLLMFDGIPENDIWKQTTWMSRQYPVSQIKQIEVVYGPASALYGTNAFSGIINVITKKGSEVGAIDVVTTAGSYGRKNLEVSSGSQISKLVSFNITGKYFAADNLHQWDYFDGIGKDPNVNNFSQSYRNAMGTDAYYMIEGEKVQVPLDDPLPYDNYALHANLMVGDFTFTALNWTKKEAEGYFYSPFKRRGQYAQWWENNQGYSLSHNKAINDKISFSTNIIYRNHRLLNSQEVGHKYYTSPLPEADSLNTDYESSQSIVHNDPTTYQLKPREVVLANGDTTNVTGIVDIANLSTWDLSFEEQMTYNISDKLNFIVGGKFSYTDTQEDYQYGHHLDDMPVSPRHQKNTYAGYGQIIYNPINIISLTLGGRYEYQNDENKEILYDIFTPRASIILKAADGIIFRLQYAEAFQEPDDWHKFSTDADVRPLPSLTLEPEKLRALEFGTNMKLGRKLFFTATVYHTRVTNFIGSVNNTVANPYNGITEGYHFENISNMMTIYGYESTMNAELAKGLFFNANVSGAWNYGVADKMEQDANGNWQPMYDSEGNSLTDERVLIGDIAPVKVNAGFLYKYQNKFSIYPKVNFVATKQTINWRENPDIDPIFTEIEGYAIFGLNLNILNTFGFVKGLDFNVKLDNLTNTEYYNPGSRSANGTKYMARVLQPCFNFMAGLSYSFK